MTAQIAPCPCGTQAFFNPSSCRVSCDMPGCWEGPIFPTAAEAIAAWNTVMEAVALKERITEVVNKAAELAREEGVRAGWAACREKYVGFRDDPEFDISDSTAAEIARRP